jgi:hypothetical protein
LHVLTAERNIRFSEAKEKEKRQIAKLAVTARPDLTIAYGSGRDEQDSSRKPRPEPDEAARLFSEALERELVARGLDPLSDQDRSEAARRVAKSRPELVPTYGSELE